MSFRVVVSREVEDAIDAQIGHLVAQGAPADRMDRWISGLLELIDSLYQWPRRFPAAETVSAAMGHKVRRANYGDYALFFRIDDTEQIVHVVAFRHGRQRPLHEHEDD